MNKKVRALLVVLSVSSFTARTPVAKAADTEVGTAQVAGFGGLVAGIGTHGTVGGGLAYAATERLLAVGEFSYIPGGSEKISGEGFAVKGSAKAYDFNGGIHFQFPLKEPKAVPYVAAGVGALHSSASVRTTVMGTTVSTKASATDFYFNFGGGLRYYISDRWGIRPELKIFAGDETFVRLAIGIFYQFGK
jgi:hypothetical protein